MIFIFWLVIFIFFKVITKFAFDHSMSILAAAIVSAVYSWLMLSAQLAAARTLDANPVRVASNDRAFVGAFVVPYAIFTAAAVGASLLIVYGFSDRLADDLLRGYGHENELAWFIAIASIPAICHAILAALHARQIVRNRW